MLEDRADERAPRRFDAPPPEPPHDDLRAALDELPDLDLDGLDAPGRLARARAFLEAGRAAIQGRFEAGAGGRTVVRLHSALIDRLLQAAWGALWGDRPGAALGALGGYGRSELAPASDVDLLFLHVARSPDALAALREASEAVLYLLWDSGLQVGQAVRTPEECRRLAETDHSARTALLDCRFLAGDKALYDTFEREILGEVHSRRVDHYVRDKVTEWRARHGRFGDTVFRLEPDVKSGEGGLRDLHTALWIARACYHAAGISDLGRRMLLPPRELEDLRAARDFLWRVRNALHYRAGRRQDHLTFDAQEDLAESLGYQDQDHELAVERFMRDYYLSARTVMRASRDIIERCIESRGQTPFGVPSSRKVAPGFKLWKGRLTVEDASLFQKDPAALVRFFALADREDLPLYSFARALVREAAGRIDEATRSREDVALALRELFESKDTRGRFLQPMHESGLLGALIPEFGRQTGLWQHDLYHTYTVDAHSLFAVQRLLELRAGEAADPVFTPIMQGLEHPYALLLGTLLHDVGKGLGGGHSEKGAALIPGIARRLHLLDEEADEVAFLVRAHLRMSHVSQRRDLSDPQLIGAFAEEMGSLRRLTMLFLLTFADVGTTGDGTWTDWKARLLVDLYTKAREHLVERESGPPGTGTDQARRGAGVIAARLARARPPEAVDAFLRILPERYLATVRPEKALAHLSLLERLGEEGAVLRRIQHPAKGYTELIVAAGDRPGLLSDLTGTLAAHRVDILAADIYSLADGRILDVFLVRDRRGGLLTERERWETTRKALVQAAKEEGLGAALVARRLGPSRLGPRPAPPVPVKVTVDNASSARHTVIDVFARDRLGLLHTITRRLHELGLSVVLARISTEAHRATDAFYVTGEDGRKVVEPRRLEALVQGLEAALADADAQAARQPS